MTGRCHCGKVTITVAECPAYMFDCDCSMCGKHGVVWGYFAADQVAISGETQSYSRVDRERPSVHVHFCGTCGCTTHWTPTRHIRQDQMGANMRIFDAKDLSGVPLHFPDGKGWSGEGPFEMRRKSTVL
jgi:hypothetical protein